MERVAYQGWPNCIRLANAQLELIATTDIGPRIIHLGLLGSENIFAVVPDHAGQVGGDEWRIYGGHRLWHSPEAKPRSYYPDNGPIDATLEGRTLRLTQPIEPTTGIRKTMEVTLSPDEPCVRVRHLLENHGLWPVELAAWAMSAMNLEGVAIVPQSTLPTQDGLLPDRVMVLWPFSDACDPRFSLGRRYITLRQDPHNDGPFEVGLNASAGWAAYWRRDQLFVKCFSYDPRATYPDYGCSVEAYTCDRWLELETLGPLTRLEPGACVEHIEHWFLFDQVAAPESEEDIQRSICPLAEKALAVCSGHAI